MSLVFIGGVEVGFTCLERVVAAGHPVAGVITLPWEAAEGTSGYVDFGPFCAEHDIPLLRTWQAAGPEALALAREWSPALGVVCGWQRLVGPEMLGLPPRGFVGFHTSLLPHYRGRAPVNWAIIKGEKRTGTTMFFLEPEADTGPIIAQTPFAIEPFDTCASIYEKSARACGDMLLAALPGLLQGTALTRPNPSLDYPCMPKRTPADGEIDWSRLRPGGARFRAGAHPSLSRGLHHGRRPPVFHLAGGAPASRPGPGPGAGRALPGARRRGVRLRPGRGPVGSVRPVRGRPRRPAG